MTVLKTIQKHNIKCDKSIYHKHDLIKFVITDLRKVPWFKLSDNWMKCLSTSGLRTLADIIADSFIHLCKVSWKLCSSGFVSNKYHKPATAANTRQLISPINFKYFKK